MGYVSFIGNLFVLSGPKGDSIYMKVADEFVKSIKEHLINKFNESIQLSIMLGSRTDQEAIRAIIRSIKVRVKSYETFEFTTEFNDDYSHWYAGQELPDDVAETLRVIINEGTKDWIKSGKPQSIMNEVLGT